MGVSFLYDILAMAETCLVAQLLGEGRSQICCSEASIPQKTVLSKRSIQPNKPFVLECWETGQKHIEQKGILKPV